MNNQNLLMKDPYRAGNEILIEDENIIMISCQGLFGNEVNNLANKMSDLIVYPDLSGNEVNK